MVGETRIHHHRALRRLAITAGVSILLLLIIRLVLDPIAAHFTRKALESSDDMRGDFSKVHVTLMPPGYEIRHLKLVQEPEVRFTEPLLYADSAEVTLDWRALLHGRLAASLFLDGPKVTLIQSAKKKETKPQKPLPDVLRQALPARVDRIEVFDGEVLIVDGPSKDAGRLWIHKAHVLVENLATRRALMHGKRATLAVTAEVQRSGKLNVDADLDPFTPKLTFSSKSALRDLELRDLSSFVVPKTGLQPQKGSISVFAEVIAKNGTLSGGVKPVLKDVELESVDKGLGKKLKAALADLSLDVLSDDKSGRDAVATTIPIKGTIDDPHVQVVPTVLGVVRNAFVIGLSEGFSNLPPETADQKQGVLRQAWRALKKGDGPPDAQPEHNAAEKAEKQDKNASDKKSPASSAAATPHSRQGRRPGATP